MQKQVVIIFGPPGAGKGTQAELLADRIGLYHFESSKVLEACFKSEDPEKYFNIDGQNYKIKDEIKRWQTGLLNSPPFVVNLFTDKIRDLATQDKSLIFSGSPRTVYEADKEIPLFIELFGRENINIFKLEISAETTIFRNTHRKICELMRHSILFNKDTENLTLCPLDGSKLTKRKDLDDPEVIKRRLDVFKNETFPICDVIEKQGLKINKINGEQSPADVFNDILKVIK
jgi:adenylate kinase